MRDHVTDPGTVVLPELGLDGSHRRHRDPRTLSDLALAQLRESILSGQLAPGTRLPLREQVERLAMSNLPVREALNRLEQVGLVEQVPHKGARVAPMSTEDMRDTYRLRIVLESMAVRAAAERFDDRDVERCRAWLERYDETSRSTDRPRARHAHSGFHYAVYEASGSRWLMRLIPMLWDNAERYLRMTISERGDVPHRVAEHEQLLEVCAANDPDGAERLLTEHLATTVALVEQKLEADRGEEEVSGTVGAADG